MAKKKKTRAEIAKAKKAVRKKGVSKKKKVVRKPTKRKTAVKSRSIAAKKGWVTRHNKSKKNNYATRKQKKIIDKANLAISDILEKDPTWVPDAMPGFLKLSNTLAYSFSRVRMLDVDTQLLIRNNLLKAEAEGNLEIQINELSMMLRIPVQEMWTFWYSP